MVIAFWVPGEKKPSVVQHGTYENEELCDNEVDLLTFEWAHDVNGGTTSFICIGAYPGQST